MALFEDLIQALGGAAQVASGIGALQQGGITARTQLPPPLPSSAELTNLQLQHALNLANLQAAGYDVTGGAGGSMTLTPRTTPSDVLQQQLGGAGAGLQQQLANLGPQTSTLGNQLNTQALAGARGTPQVNRAALIQAIQQKRGPSTGLGLQAPGPTPITAGPLSTATPFSNVPSLGSLSRQQAGASPFLTRTLPTALGLSSAALPLLSRLFSGSGLGGPSLGGSITSSDLFGFPASLAEQEAIGNAGSGMGSFDFSSLQNVPMYDDWQWVPEADIPFGDINFGLT